MNYSVGLYSRKQTFPLRVMKPRTIIYSRNQHRNVTIWSVYEKLKPIPCGKPRNDSCRISEPNIEADATTSAAENVPYDELG